MTEDTAREAAAYTALQRTSYMFTDPPEGIVTRPAPNKVSKTLNSPSRTVLCLSTGLQWIIPVLFCDK